MLNSESTLPYLFFKEELSRLYEDASAKVLITYVDESLTPGADKFTWWDLGTRDVR